jgi:hypothetical protein
VIGGIILALPGNEVIGFSHWQINAAAAVVIATGVIASWLGRRVEGPIPSG